MTKLNKEKFLILNLILILVVFCFACLFLTGCGKTPPVKISDQNFVMPEDNPDDYDIYRVISVDKSVTKNDLVALMEYFTHIYLDEKHVMIYVFNLPNAANMGNSDALVATFYQDMRDENNRKIDREIFLK